MPKPKHDKRDYKIGHLFCLCIFSGILVTVIALFMTWGELWGEIFWYDPIDTGMDFFHSIEYVRGRQPYEVWRTLYPPLANLFFYILYRIVPLEISVRWKNTFDESIAARGTSIDLRVSQSTAVLFILFILVTCIALLGVIQKYIGDRTEAFWVSIAVIFSYGVLYAYERGNIIIIVLICSMFFVFFKDSANRFVAELALIMLAIAAGLKLYPAFLGFLLLYDKQFTKAVRAIIYGIMFFVLPFFLFHEGIEGFKIFLETLFSYTNADTLAKAAEGFSLVQILSSITLLLQNAFGMKINEDYLLGLFSTISLITVLVLLALGFLVKKRWQRVLLCTVAIVLYSYQADYIVSFLSIPLLIMVKEEKTVDGSNLFPFITVILTQVTLPITGELFGIWHLTDFRMQVCILLCVVYLIKGLFQNIKMSGKKNLQRIFAK